MKNKYIKICLLLIVLVVSCFVLSSVEAAITTNDGTVGVDSSDNELESAINEGINGFGQLIEIIVGMAASGLFALLGALINILSMFMFLVLNVLFDVAISNDVTELSIMPMPDSIVFNKFSFFDANFVNPSTYSMVGAMSDILENLFASFQTIAISIFVIAAMLMGMRLALTTIASKKAIYKEATLKWVSGFLILICLRWILAGVFYINEYLVATLYGVIDTTEMSIPIYLTAAVPIFGQALTSLIKAVSSLWGGDGTLIYLPGYYGIFMSNLLKGIGGDIVASIVGFILMGQTLTIVGSYIKRVFMSILLGIISPIIVAVDTIKSSNGSQSTIFKNWLQNFCVVVFMQSFHAMYMVVVLSILSKLYAKPAHGTQTLNVTQISVITIVLTTGLVKLEKLLKNLFGITDSLAGDLKDGGKSMMKAIGAAKGLTMAAGAIKDNVPKMQDAAKRKQAAGKQLNNLKEQKQAANNKYQQAMAAARDAKHRKDTAEYTKQLKIAMEARREGVFGKEGANGQKKNNSNNNQDVVKQAINNANNSNVQNNNNMTLGQQIKKAEEDYAQAHADLKSATLANLMAPANIAAGLGLGIGLDDNVADILTKGSVITTALDKGAEIAGYKAADRDRKTFYEYEKQEGERLGYRPSEKIIREKTSTEKLTDTIKEKVIPRNEDGKVDMKQSIVINPVAVGKEIAKQLSSTMDVFTDTMKKELRHIDRDLDDSQ